ncbi:unnamed protein product [Nesidiocoris tenuis]|uniref:Uncharacterized protein n=1 Tax=Nesidiocoris tenuis TaxID=355587 RepID=A0A6H5GZA3_9HEMI|nr:unnamed protein product [Nesidiocoris tenuis]
MSARSRTGGLDATPAPWTHAPLTAPYMASLHGLLHGPRGSMHYCPPKITTLPSSSQGAYSMFATHRVRISRQRKTPGREKCCWCDARKPSKFDRLKIIFRASMRSGEIFRSDVSRVQYVCAACVSYLLFDLHARVSTYLMPGSRRANNKTADDPIGLQEVLHPYPRKPTLHTPKNHLLPRRKSSGYVRNRLPLRVGKSFRLKSRGDTSAPATPGDSSRTRPSPVPPPKDDAKGIQSRECFEPNEINRVRTVQWCPPDSFVYFKALDSRGCPHCSRPFPYASFLSGFCSRSLMDDWWRLPTDPRDLHVDLVGVRQWQSADTRLASGLPIGYEPGASLGLRKILYLNCHHGWLCKENGISRPSIKKRVGASDLQITTEWLACPSKVHLQQRPLFRAVEQSSESAIGRGRELVFAAELAEEQGYGPLVEGDDGTRWNVIVRRWARKIARWKNDGIVAITRTIRSGTVDRARNQPACGTQPGGGPSCGIHLGGSVAWNGRHSETRSARLDTPTYDCTAQNSGRRRFDCRIIRAGRATHPAVGQCGSSDTALKAE